MQKLVITARIDDQTHRDLKEIAEREDRGLSYLVRKAVEAYIAVKAGENGDRKRG